MFNPNLSDAGIPDQSPFLSGLSEGADTYTQLLNAFAAPQMMKLKQQETQSTIALQNAQAQALMNKQAQDPWLSDLGKTQADLREISKQFGSDSPEYQAALNQLQIKLNMQSAMTNSRNAYASGLPFMMQPKIFKEQIGSQVLGSGVPVQYLPGITANMNQYFPLPRQNVGNTSMSAPTPQGGQSNNQLSPQAVQTLQNNPQAVQQLGLTSGTSQGMTPTNIQPSTFGLAPTPAQSQQAQQLGDQAQSAILAGIIPKDSQVRLAAAGRARVFANQLMQQIPTVSQYFGPQGSVRLTKDKLQSVISGNAPQSLQDLVTFNNTLTGYKEEAATMLKVPADQQGRGDFNKAFDLNSWYTNPKLAQASLTNIIQRVTDAERVNAQTVSQLVTNSAKPLAQPGMPAANQTSQQFTDQLTKAPVKYVGDAKAVKGSDGKWYKRGSNGRLIEAQGGQ